MGNSIDLEKIIKGLNCCCHTDGSNCAKCPYDIADSDCTAQMSMDVLALLKEQDETIKELQSAYGYLQKQFFEAQDKLLKEQETQRDYEASVEMTEYCERYEQTYNPEDGSM